MCTDKRPLIFGEVLFDCFPDGREVLGGAPFNVAWNLQALGLSPLLFSRVGDDPMGSHIRKTLDSWGLDCSGLQVDPLHPTGRVKIELSDGEPQFTILPDQAYDHISAEGLELMENPAFLYHGSLALRNGQNRTALAFLKKKHSCPIFVDVNLRTPWWNAEQVFAIIEDATWLKLNEAEFNILFPGPGNLKARCRNLLDRFKLEAVFVTLGAKGAVALHRENIFSSTTPREDVSIMDTVGAGDAFSSVLLLGLMHGWSLDLTLQNAQDFASAVVGHRGAITHEKMFYETYKNRWDM